jgi:hypothetical protein
MKFLILNGKSRRQSCGARDEICMGFACLFQLLAGRTLDLGDLGKLDHFVVADAGCLAVPEGAQTAARPAPGDLDAAGTPEVIDDSVMNAVDHRLLTVPAIAGDLGNEVSG